MQTLRFSLPEAFSSAYFVQLPDMIFKKHLGLCV